MGGRPIAEINALEILAMLRRIEGRALRDQCWDLRGALPPIKQEHFASIREPDEVDELLRAIEGFRGIFVVQCALRLAPPFFVSPRRASQGRVGTLQFGQGRMALHRL